MFRYDFRIDSATKARLEAEKLEAVSKTDFTDAELTRIAYCYASDQMNALFQKACEECDIDAAEHYSAMKDAFDALFKYFGIIE